MGNSSGKSEYAGYDSYDESEEDEKSVNVSLKKLKDDCLKRLKDGSLKKLNDDSLKRLEDNNLKKFEDSLEESDDVEKDQDIVDNVFDKFQEILDDHHRVVEEMFDEMERSFLGRYSEEEKDEGYEEDSEEDQIDVVDRVSLSKTGSPMDLL